MDVNVEAITTHGYIVLAIFLIGYATIIFEQLLNVNKAATALLMAVACWTVLFLEPYESVERHTQIFTVQMFKVSQVLFFLLGALIIVEIINTHQGFNFITKKLAIPSKLLLLWSIGIITFFLSSVLDNLTTTIVMVSLVAKLVKDRQERLMLCGVAVIAANAGGAWTPIGDVATTLLWISGEITTWPIMRDLFLPSIAGLGACLLWFSPQFKGEFEQEEIKFEKNEPYGNLILILGISALIFVPIFKILTDLPPFMGMMLSVGLMWLITDLLHFRHPERDRLRVPSILTKVDVSIILFYLGILLSINALESAGLLKGMANWLNVNTPTPLLIPIIIGLISSVVDNVSLVAATIAMYGTKTFAIDSSFWQTIAYCAGTGGSILIIGSAAGVAFMSLEKVDFMWYLKKITIPALLTYFTGIGVYFLLHLL